MKEGRGGLRDIEFTSPDEALYPEYDELLQMSMVEETELFFQELLDHDLSLLNFIDSDFSMLNSRLAELHTQFGDNVLADEEGAELGVHVVGISTLAGAHRTIVPELMAALKEEGQEDVTVVVGGVIPPEDYDALRKAGASAIFGPGTVIADAAVELIDRLEAELD